MERTVTYKEPTHYAINNGWKRIKVVHVKDRSIEYKEFYYVSSEINSFNGEYFEHLYKTIWIKCPKT